MPELVKIIKDCPPHILDAGNDLTATSGQLVSIGFNRPDIPKYLWAYIYDEDIFPARVYSPSLKSINKKNMMYTNKITIAIPVYERTDFFEIALNSALNQTVQVPILVIDNASSHNKFETICSQYVDRVTYIKNEYNIGMWPNWNKCAKKANSEYIFILGDDDIMESNYVEIFLSRYEENPSIDVFYSDFKLRFDGWGKSHTIKWKEYNIWGYNNGLQIKKNAATKGLCFPTIACVVRRELLLQMPLISQPHASNDWFFYYHLPDDTLFYGENQELVTYRKHAKADTMSPVTSNNCTLSHQCMKYELLKYISKKDRARKKVEIYSTIMRFYVFNNQLTRKFFSVDSPYKTIRKKMFKFCDFIPIIKGCLSFMIWIIKKTIKKVLFLSKI